MHILVALDRSEESYNALVTAIDIASALDGRITAVHAVDDPASDGRPESPDGEAILDDAAERAAKRDVSIETELLAGAPAEAIPDYAERAGVDVIYVGHRGLSGAGDELSGDDRGPLGSIAKGIARRTQIPVTVFDRAL